MGWIVAGRLIDRVGKGIRGAPRDALVADITLPEVRGAAFGLRQSLDTVGAFTGPLIAVGLMLLWQNDFRAVFWVAVLPAVLAVIVLACGVREPKNSIALDRRMNPISIANLKRLSLNYWAVVMFGAVFTLARFSEAFLVLRAQQLGVALAWVPLVMVAMNAVYALSAYPFGYLSDKVSHRALLAGGLLVLIAADFCLANAVDWKVLMCGVMLWGFHMGMTQGLLARMVVDASPADLRGTAFGFFNLMTGIAMLIASVLAGYVWDGLGAAYTFYVGAGISALALVGLSALNFQAKNL
jgi:MFS family permease